MKNDKEKYETPEVSVMYYNQVSDIIATSNNNDLHGGDNYSYIP